MSDTVIQVENLGKKYIIGHQKTGRSRYVSLRDVIADGARSLTERIRHPRKAIQPAHQEDFWALKDASFEVKQGEVVGIIGRNGAGKSTLLKLLSRITEPTTGQIRLRGRVASLLEVGTGFHPELTGRENIFLNGSILGMSKVEIKKKFDEIVEFAEIVRFLDTPVKRYSSGMYVRLAFAVAAHLEPEILVVDEVLAVGDAAFQKKCLGKMQNVASKEGRTILFVSHDMPAIKSLCHRTYLIDKGSLIKEGTPEEVITTYLSRKDTLHRKEIDLKSHPNRASYSRENAIEKAYLINELGEKTQTFEMGEKIGICFEFNCSCPIINPGFGFGVSDIYGRRVFSLNNYMIPNEKNSFKSIQSGSACLSVPNLPLMPGTYLTSISIVENQVEWIDFVESILEFEIIPSDVFGSGKIPDKAHGVIFTHGNLTVDGK